MYPNLAVIEEDKFITVRCFSRLTTQWFYSNKPIRTVAYPAERTKCERCAYRSVTSNFGEVLSLTLQANSHTEGTYRCVYGEGKEYIELYDQFRLVVLDPDYTGKIAISRGRISLFQLTGMIKFSNQCCCNSLP